MEGDHEKPCPSSCGGSVAAPSCGSRGLCLLLGAAPLGMSPTSPGCVSQGVSGEV